MEVPHSNDSKVNRKGNAADGIVDNGRTRNGRNMGSRFELKVYVPQKFHSKIIGSKGSTKAKLDQETNTVTI